jgi:hypothetical protein
VGWGLLVWFGAKLRHECLVRGRASPDFVVEVWVVEVGVVEIYRLKVRRDQIFGAEFVGAGGLEGGVKRVL